MNILKIVAALLIVSQVSLSPAFSQFPEIKADEVRSWVAGKKKAVLIDTRTTEEYAAGHIPGAISVPADRMKAERSKLPRDPSTPLIFYCRGAG